MSEVDISREAIEKLASVACSHGVPAMLYALRDALDAAHADLAECYCLTGADPSGGMKGDVDEDWRLAPEAVREVRRLRKEYDDAEATIARQQRAIERKDWALRMLKDKFPSDFDNMWKDALAYTGNGGEG